MTVFMDCLFDTDFTGLIQEGKPPDDQLLYAWDKIFTEYCGLMQSDTYNELFEVQKQLNVIQAKITLVENICQHLEVAHDDILTGILKSLGLRPGNPVDIAGVRQRAKKFLIDIETKRQDYNKLVQNHKEITREYFFDLLSMLSHEFQYAVKAADITVYQFCKDVLNTNTRYEQQKMKNDLKIA